MGRPPRLYWLMSIVLLGCQAPPASGDPQPAQPASGNEAEHWLERAEKRLEKIKSIKAKIKYVRIEGVGLFDSKETRKGDLVYQPGPPTRFSVHFQQLIAENRATKIGHRFIYNRGWLVECDDVQKVFRKQQMLASDADPAKAGPLGLGDTPFIVPINLPKKQLVKKHVVTLVARDKNDPPNSVHLLLKPKPNIRTDIIRIDLWYDRTTVLLIRAESVDDGPNKNIVELSMVEVDRPIGAKVFDVSSPPKGEGWDVTIELHPSVRAPEGGGR